MRLVAAVLLAASTLVWMPVSPVGAWSSDDGAVAVFGSSSSYNDWSHSVAVDSSGNVYTAGMFYGTVDFDPGAGTENHTPVGGTDAYLLKLDSSGDYAWVAVFGNSQTDTAQGVAVDSSGNVYVTGSFEGTVDFDPGSGTDNHTSTGSKDVFVLKLDSSGDLVWAKSFGGSANNDQGFSIAVDSSGNVYVAGEFHATVDFDPGEGTAELTPVDGTNGYALKLDSSGAYVWAQPFG